MDRWPRLSHLFEVDNARNLSREEIVKTFVPTNVFWRLLSAKNHVVLGSRGSGKTQIAKMLSHSHLASFDNEEAKEIVKKKNFIGFYISAKLNFSSSNFWNNQKHEDTNLNHFIWSLNLASCTAFVDTANSCLEQYIHEEEERIHAEYNLSSKLSKLWSNGRNIVTNFNALFQLLNDIAHDKRNQETQLRILGTIDGPAVGAYFFNELYFPLNRAIDLLKRIIEFPAHCRWLVCLDEVEWLTESHHKLLNTHLRTDNENMFFKITTMPYRHYTLETFTEVQLNERHDFEYVYIDKETWNFGREFQDVMPDFVRKIFKSRVRAAGYSQFQTLRHILGNSKLLDEKDDDWSPKSVNEIYLQKYANTATKNRIEKLRKSQTRYMDQIIRKIRPAVLLRRVRETSKGRAEIPIYCGASLIARCSDNNPRTLIQIIRKLLTVLNTSSDNDSGFSKGVLKSIPELDQHRIMMEYSSSFLRRIQAEENGHRIYSLLDQIGSHMSDQIHRFELGTDFVSSIKVDLQKDIEVAKLVREAVGLGYLYPNVNPKDPDRLPHGLGTFQLAFVLAPHFWLIPRKGEARQLSFFLRQHKQGDQDENTEELFER